ncbi:hypothetical protein BD779DRAFT_1512721, partial [Infundibulicybe gibba]
LVAQDPLAFDTLPLLDEDDKAALRHEITHKWSQPAMLYYLVILCSVAAAVQGMDESVINGANLFFAPQFGIDPNLSQRNSWLLGLVNSAPYLCCAVLNRALGRRGTIFVTATFSFLTCIWQHLFVARFFLGIGIGPKSATVPVYAAEFIILEPQGVPILNVLHRQTWTAFGIMMGFVADLAFFKVPTHKPHITGLNWRLMLSSAGIPALFIMAQVFLCPESPRWYVSKGRYDKAYESLARLRHKPIQAARDLYCVYSRLLEAEKDIKRDRSPFVELFTVPRNRRATLASFIVMFICGVNAIAYYSSNIFVQANFSQIQALLASFGFGAINFLFAFPAIYTIDTFGRRNLLLTTFPLMAVFLLLTGFGFWIPAESKARIGVVALGIYLFGMAYSPGEGPVPFTYSAEAFPLYVRDIGVLLPHLPLYMTHWAMIGMSAATATLWFFNFVISITFPPLINAFTPQGAFGWFAAWNIVGFFAALLFVPETKALSLEELDQVFSVPTHVHAAYQIKALPHFFKRYVLRKKIPDLPPLYQHEGAVSDAKSEYPGTGRSSNA